MRASSRPRSTFIPDMPFFLICLLMASLWLAGGASREDVLGQVVVRLSAGGVLIIAALFGPRPEWRAISPAGWFVFAAVALAIVQLIPLPPGIWHALPGRAVFEQADTFDGAPSYWRPLSLVPGATVNALLSLLVPVAVLVLSAELDERRRALLPDVLLIAVCAMALMGLLQISGVYPSNPFANETPGQASGMFANRNHFALFLAFGCLLAPVWAFRNEAYARRRGFVALGLVVIFVLTALGTGSRVGVALAGLAVSLGLLLTWRNIRRSLAGLPGWAFPALVGATVLLVLAFVGVSIAADRAVALNRLFAGDTGADMRLRGLPVVLTSIVTYFPAGSGFGSFNPVFRMHEPLALLKPTYFNHAHNDFLEIVLDAGLPGLLLLAAAIGWWAWASLRVWRAKSRILPRLGSAMLLLVMAASIFDYPARTPMIMATIVIAAVWLSVGQGDQSRSALPRKGQHLKPLGPSIDRDLPKTHA